MQASMVCPIVAGAVHLMPNQENILFLHIPKTAGTSLKRYLSHRFAAKQCLLDPTPQALREAHLDDYALVAGHFDSDVAGRYRSPPLVVTSLRNPVDRAISAYNYQRTPRLEIEIRSIAERIGIDVAAQVLDEIRRLNDCANLADFLRREPELAQKNLGNVQTRVLAGAAAAQAHARDPRQLLAKAKENLRRCAGILLTERMPESLAGLDRLLGPDEFGALTHDNVTPDQAVSVPLDPMLAAALAELTDLDLELYRFAEQLWHERLPSRHGTIDQVPRLEDRLPDATDFWFDQPIRGRGWHIREKAADHWYCWSDQLATLHLALDTAGSHVLRFWVDYAASREALHGLEVRVNGVPVGSVPTETGDRFLVETRVPAAAVSASAGRVCIEFRVPHTVRPSDRDPKNPDTRRLGIALSRLQLLRTSDGHADG
jgi:hypothetical protein